jgi:glycosyltransferase involved in cell wall biosynthesis
MKAEAFLGPSPRNGNGVNVLMSTHKGETGTHLAEALESLYSQTLKPDRIVLVEDGPIGPDQHDVLAAYCRDGRGPRLTRIALPENGGLARALNTGLAYCDGDYVMRMDSDDIAMPDRLEIQLSYLKTHPEIDIVSSWANEFSDGLSADRLKVSPTEHDALAMALRWRNVIAHSAILMKTSVLSKLDGYRPDFGLLEDYDLWVRMVMSGARFHVLPKVLLSIRTGLGQRGRRGNWNYMKSEIRFRTECLRIGFLTRTQFCATLVLYAVFRLASPVMRQRIYALARTRNN